MRRADPHRALIRALASLQPQLIVLASRSEPWASATFVGARHILTCEGEAPAGIEEAEFALPGHLVADVAWRRDGRQVIVEALTIEAN